MVASPGGGALAGRVALITGGALGMGRAEADLFAAEGATVFLSDRLLDEGRAAAAAISGCRFVELDVASEAGWDAAIAEIRSQAGGLDILVNNAGISHFSTLEETSLADFTRVLEINLIGVFLGMRAATPLMRAGGGGSIVNVSSIAGMTGRTGLGAYSASKWAVRGLSRSAALELGQDRIRVNTILPGLVETPMTMAAYGAEEILQRGSGLAVGRAGTPGDIAAAALYLASDASGFCTGSEILCDGGQLAGQ